MKEALIKKFRIDCLAKVLQGAFGMLATFTAKPAIVDLRTM